MDILGPDRGGVAMYGGDFRRVDLAPSGGVSPSVDMLPSKTIWHNQTIIK